LSVLLFILRVLLLMYAVFAVLFSAMFDNNLTALLYVAAVVLALYGLFKPRASLAALACILVATLTSWGGGNPGH
jgi:Na+/H+ antiporter NhaD/arsenite permease-like protein